MKNLKAKLRKNGGFTLVEMLIVVAIIAILVAVSIPLVGSALDKANLATDAANERAFKGALVSGYLLTSADMQEGVEIKADTVYTYDALNGKVGSTSSGYGKSGGIEGAILYGFVSSEGEVSMEWSTAAIANTSGVTNSNLVSPTVVAPPAAEGGA